MAMNKGANKQYKTMKGKIVDLELLRQRNEMTPAVGNARVNARGDQLGPGGQIIRKRDEILDEYYKDHPQAVADEVPNKPVQAVEPEVQVEAVKAPAKKAVKTSTSKVEEEMKAIDEEADAWVEDSDGNFVQKGD